MKTFQGMAADRMRRERIDDIRNYITGFSAGVACGSMLLAAIYAFLSTL
ncbi:hypothetical protein [Celeribacter sp.]